MKISQKAFDMTVREEVTSQAYYERHYTRPEWPGLSSGVTVGIGYDLGQASRQKIQQDWSGLVSADMLLVMMSCSGYTGAAGKQKCAEVKNKIDIPWDAAIKVFANRDVPAWSAAVLKAVPNSDRLTPSCFGVLFDLAYNRGNSWNNSGERYREMRAIRDDVKLSKLTAVPGEIVSMKRLWLGTQGLLNRCDHRIALWNDGLKETGHVATAPVGESKPDSTVPLDEGSARTKPPATSKTQNGTTGAIVIGGGAAVEEAARNGLISTDVAIFAGFVVVLIAISIWWIWWRNRNPA